MRRITDDDFESQLTRVNADRALCQSWIVRMIAALRAANIDRVEEFEDQLYIILREREWDTIEHCRAITASLLSDGYGSLYARVLPDESTFAADIFA